MRLEGCVYIYSYDYCLYSIYINIYIYIYIYIQYIRYILRVGVVVVFLQTLDVSFFIKRSSIQYEKTQDMNAVVFIHIRDPGYTQNTSAHTRTYTTENCTGTVVAVID